MAKITVPGKTIDGDSVEFEVVRDSWQDLRLADGTHLRVKILVRKIYRNREVASPSDTNAYVVVSQVIAFVDPEEAEAKEAPHEPDAA